MSTDEPFRLVNDKPTPKPLSIETSDRTRQKSLFSGLDCLPGQMDLFDADGSEPIVVAGQSPSASNGSFHSGPNSQT